MLKIKRDVNLGIFLLRLGVGIVFLIHGIGKLFAIGPFALGVSGFAGLLSAFGGAAIVVAVIIALIETIGGLFLILGLFTNIASLLLAIEMLIAIFMVHIPNGFYASNGELALILLLGALAILFIGAGKYSVCKSKK